MSTPPVRPAAVFLSCLLFAPAAARAVDNSRRVIAIGALTQFSGDLDGSPVPAQLSVKAAVGPRVEISGLFGVRFDSNAAFLPGLKIAYVLLPETNMNLYVAAGMSLELRSTGGLEAFLYQLGPGVEVFFSDFPNLGLAFEFGLGGVARSAPATSQGLGTTSSGTIGSAGVHYYF